MSTNGREVRLVGVTHTMKERNQPFPTGAVGTVMINTTPIYNVNFPASSYSSREVTWSQGHPGPPYKEGGWFTNWEAIDPRAELKSVGDYRAQRAPVRRYVGGFFCGNFGNSLYSNGLTYVKDVGTSASPLTEDSAWSPYKHGATAWNRFRPGKSVADAAQFIAEMKDVPRMLQTSAKGFAQLWRSMGGSRTAFGPKNVADHWLNTQFGWMPFLNDLCKFKQTYDKADDYYNRARRNNGRWVRRHGTVVDDVESELLLREERNTAHNPLLDSYFYAPGLYQTGNYTVSRVKTEKAWFTGRFRYWVPNIDSVQFKDSFLRQLYGLNVSPSLVYELTPWSWLADWFSNAGDVLSNADNGWASNLVSNYAYTMMSREVSVEVNSLHALLGNPLNDTWNFSISFKGRSVAHPFGFGVLDGDLSARQQSILAALGISRV